MFRIKPLALALVLSIFVLAAGTTIASEIESSENTGQKLISYPIGYMILKVPDSMELRMQSIRLP